MLNPREYLLNPDDTVMVFSDVDAVLTFLRKVDPSVKDEDELNEQGIYLERGQYQKAVWTPDE